MRFTVKELEVIIHLVDHSQCDSPSDMGDMRERMDNVVKKAKAEIAIRTLKVRRAVEKDL